MGVALGDQPGDPAGEHPGLARAGAGDHEQGRALVDDGLALRLVETLEQLLAGRPAASGGFCSPRTAVVRGRRLRGKTGEGELRSSFQTHITCGRPDRSRDLSGRRCARVVRSGSAHDSPGVDDALAVEPVARGVAHARRR